MNGQRRGFGIFLTCLAFSGLSIADAILKWISARSPINQTFFIATSAAALFLFGYARWKNGISSFRTTHIKLHSARGFVFFVQLNIGIYALRHIPLANFYALVFIAPMFITVLSAVFLKEKADWQQWLATVMGFLGVLIVLRPDSNFNWAGLLVLSAALLYSTDVIFMQVIGRKEPPITVMFYLLATSLPWALLSLIFQYAAILPTDFIWMVLTGLLMVMSWPLVATGFKLATTPVAAPFHYIQLIWGVGLGWLLWNDLPDIWSVLGTSIIIACGLYIARRETQTKIEPLEADVEILAPHA